MARLDKEASTLTTRKGYRALVSSTDIQSPVSSLHCPPAQSEVYRRTTKASTVTPTLDADATYRKRQYPKLSRDNTGISLYNRRNEPSPFQKCPFYVVGFLIPRQM
jgi:hypothetical protein